MSEFSTVGLGDYRDDEIRLPWERQEVLANGRSQKLINSLRPRGMMSPLVNDVAHFHALPLPQ